MNIKNVGKKIRSSVYSKLMEKAAAPRHLVGSVEQNLAGLQKNRVIKVKQREAASRMNAVNLTSNDSELRNYKQTLDRDGVLVIENFFDEKVLERIKSGAERFERSNKIVSFPNKGGYSVDWEQGNLPIGFDTVIDEKFRCNQTLHSLVEHVTKRKVNYLPNVAYEGLRLAKDMVDNVDPNGVYHQDRHFSSVKFIFYMDDVGEKESPFFYLKGSHHLNDDRVEVERLQGIYTSMQRAGRLSEIPDEWINRGRVCPPATVLQNLTNSKQLQKLTL